MYCVLIRSSESWNDKSRIYRAALLGGLLNTGYGAIPPFQSIAMLGGIVPVKSRYTIA